MGHFPAQDGLFTGRTVPVIPKMAGFLKHTVTRDQIGEWVVGDSISNRAGSPGRMNLFGQGLVGGHFARRKAQEGFPDLDLEVGAAQVD